MAARWASWGFNNTNTGGVSDTDASGAATATTGIEFRIPLSVLGAGITGITPLHVMALVTSGDYKYLSNQTLGGLPAGTGNLGQDGNGTGGLPGNTVDLLNFPGNQFFTAQRGDVTLSNGRDLAGDYRNITVAANGYANVYSPLDVRRGVECAGPGHFANPEPRRCRGARHG